MIYPFIVLLALLGIRVGTRGMITLVKENLIVGPLIVVFKIKDMLFEDNYKLLRLYKSWDILTENPNTTGVNWQEKTASFLDKNLPWESPLQIILSFIGIVGCAILSDIQKTRKRFLLVSIFGELLQTTAVFFFALFTDQIHYAGLVIISLVTTTASICGSYGLMWIMIISHIADVTPIESRMRRVMILYVIALLCHEVSSFYQWYVDDKARHHALELFSVIVLLVTLWVYIEMRLVEENSVSNINVNQELRRLKDSIVDTFRRRVLIIWVCVFVAITVAFVDAGEYEVWIREYVQQFLSLSELDYDQLVDFEITVRMTVLGLISFTLFKYPRQIDEHLFLLVSFIDKIIGNVVSSFAKNKIGVYFGAFFNSLHDITTPVIACLLTKIVSRENTAKAQLIFYFRDLLMNGIATWSCGLFGAIYEGTKKAFSATFFFISAIFYLLIMAPVVYSYSGKKRKSDKVLTSKGDRQTIKESKGKPTAPVSNTDGRHKAVIHHS